MYGKRLIAALATLTLGVAGVAGHALAQDENADAPRYGRGMGPGMMMGRGIGRDMMGRSVMACRMMHGVGPRVCIRLMEMADADDNGQVSEQESAEFWRQQVEEYDADGDGSLSLEEFAKMHAAHTRPMMVDRFQFFDDDGDATVTLSELQAPFERMNRFMGRNDGRGMRGRGMGPRGMHQGMGRGMGRGYGPGQQQRAE